MSAAALYLRPAVPLIRRSLVSKLRHPMSLASDLLAPLVLIAVFAASFGQTTRISGFPPVHSYLDFGLVGAIFMGVFFSAADVGESIAMDVENGFFDRLLVSPIPRGAILLGTLASAALFALTECLCLLAVLLVSGASIAGGPVAAVTVSTVVTVMAVGMAALTTSVGLATGTAGSFGAFIPISLIATFVSSAYAPRSLMTGWFRLVAGVNPVSWLVEDLRHQVIVGFDLGRAAQAMGMMVLLAVASTWAASTALNRRAAGE